MALAIDHVRRGSLDRVVGAWVAGRCTGDPTRVRRCIGAHGIDDIGDDRVRSIHGGGAFIHDDVDVL